MLVSGEIRQLPEQISCIAGCGTAYAMATDKASVLAILSTTANLALTPCRVICCEDLPLLGCILPIRSRKQICKAKSSVCTGGDYRHMDIMHQCRFLPLLIAPLLSDPPIVKRPAAR